MPVDTQTTDGFIGKVALDPHVKVEEFSYETFNAIADYHVVRHVGDEGKELGEYAPKITEIGQIFLDHDMEEIAGLGLVHRHFKLVKGEMKIATQVGNQVRIAARKTSDLHLQFVVPYFFKVTTSIAGGISLVPLEYAEHKDNPALFEELCQAYETIKNEAFLRDFLKVTSKLGIADVFGIVLKARDNIVLEGDESKLETGGRNSERQLLVRAVSQKELNLKKEEFTQVFWEFAKGHDGRVKPVGKCLSQSHEASEEWCGHCGGHCGHCDDHMSIDKIKKS